MKKFKTFTEMAEVYNWSNDLVFTKVADLLDDDISDEDLKIYGCDLHSRMFNEWDGFAPNEYAEKVCDSVGTWSAIRLVHKYEQDEYGEVCTPMEPNRVANMLVYIYGGFLLRQSPHLQDKMWDDVLTQKDLRIIRKEIMDWCVKNLPKDRFSTEHVLDGLVWDEYGTY